MINKCPCRDCHDRTMTCHMVCRWYQDWKAMNEEQKTDEQAEREFLRPLPRKSLKAWWKKLKGQK